MPRLTVPSGISIGNLSLTRRAWSIRGSLRGVFPALLALAISNCVARVRSTSSLALPATKASETALQVSSTVPKTGDSDPCAGGAPRPPPGGPPPFPMQHERRKLKDQFDANHDGMLDSAERAVARQFLLQEKMAATRPRAAFEPPKGTWRGPFAGRATPGRGPKVLFDDVVHPLKVSPYDPATLRTLFLSFEDSSWETQLSDFHETDIEVPATLRADTSSVLRDVGVRFRGMSSYMMVPAGYKRSLNISIDAINDKQNWQGIHTLNLLNSHEDPTYLRVLLYQEIARHYFPTPRANLVHLVINDESWGFYDNAEQFNADFVETWFGTRKGARFKVTGSPMGRGGLEYLGDDPSPYAAIYDLKTKKTNQVWLDLIRLCKVLNQTPVANLHVALEPLLDIDGTLKFLALENVLINGDGYWVRASDYNLYQDSSGKFHVIPHDTNETFMSAEHVPGFNKRGPAPGVKLDPLTGLDDPTKPLRSKLLLDPVLQKRYLKVVREIAEDWLDWARLRPFIESQQSRIAMIVKSDVHKLDSMEDFEQGTFGFTDRSGPCGSEKTPGLKPFIEQRRAFLLAHPALQKD